VVVSRYDAAAGPFGAAAAGVNGSATAGDEDVTQQVLDVCKREFAHLIVLGASTEALGGAWTQAQEHTQTHTTATESAAAARPSSVPHGAEINSRKRLLSAKLGQALISSEIKASVLVVVCPPLWPGTCVCVYICVRCVCMCVVCAFSCLSFCPSPALTHTHTHTYTHAQRGSAG
jgi:hypothetical protein